MNALSTERAQEIARTFPLKPGESLVVRRNIIKIGALA